MCEVTTVIIGCPVTDVEGHTSVTATEEHDALRIYAGIDNLNFDSCYWSICTIIELLIESFDILSRSYILQEEAVTPIGVRSPTSRFCSLRYPLKISQASINP